MSIERVSIFVVIPAYNEAPQIASVVQPLVDMGYSVVVVDDGSQDETWKLLATLAVHRLRHAVNLGQGAALQTGMTYALSQGAEYIVHFDADGQHQPQDIDILLEPLLSGKAQVTLGSRFLLKSSHHRIPWAKRLVLRGGILVNGLLTGVWLTDAHNGLRALTRRAAQAIRLKENGYAHASEILGQFGSSKTGYVERPMTVLYTAYSQRKGQPILNALNILIDLLLRKMFR
jgi:glycosyltransferase involved in cell wall biosynthesis